MTTKYEGPHKEYENDKFETNDLDHWYGGLLPTPANIVIIMVIILSIIGVIFYVKSL